MTDTVQDQIAAIERELDLAAAPERVWRALTDSAEVAAWFPDRADIPSEVGAIGWMEWDGHPRYLVRIEAVEPVSRFAWRWASADDPDFDASANLVEWTLEPTARGGTRLRLRETGFRTPASRADNVEGWLSELAELLDHLATEPWHRGIHRTYHLASSRERVWQAFARPEELAAWWGGRGDYEVRAGYVGWWFWPGHGGRFAMRIEAVEPPVYLAWSWTPVVDVRLEDATDALRTEWVLVARPDGGTDLHLLESGFSEPEGHAMNSGGWDSDVVPTLRRHLGEVA